MHAKDLKEVLRDAHAAQTPGFPAAYERVAGVVKEREIRGQFLERTVLRPPFQKIVHSSRSGGQPARTHVLDPHQALAIAKWERSQQHGVNEAEHGRASPDAEGERKHGNGGEAGVLQQLAGGVT